jgi:hypothetical protein
VSQAQPVGLASEAPVQTQTAPPSPVVPEGQSTQSSDLDVDLSQFEISPRAPQAGSSAPAPPSDP